MSGDDDLFRYSSADAEHALKLFRAMAAELPRYHYVVFGSWFVRVPRLVYLIAPRHRRYYGNVNRIKK